MKILNSKRIDDVMFALMGPHLKRIVSVYRLKDYNYKELLKFSVEEHPIMLALDFIKPFLSLGELTESNESDPSHNMYLYAGANDLSYEILTTKDGLLTDFVIRRKHEVIKRYRFITTNDKQHIRIYKKGRLVNEDGFYYKSSMQDVTRAYFCELGGYTCYSYDAEHSLCISAVGETLLRKTQFVYVNKHDIHGVRSISNHSGNDKILNLKKKDICKHTNQLQEDIAIAFITSQCIEVSLPGSKFGGTNKCTIKHDGMTYVVIVDMPKTKKD